jgi:hypothetical protein
VNTEFEADTSLWNTTDEGVRTENYPKDAEYPYTFQFETRDNQGVMSGSKATAADDAAFQQAIRDEARWQGKFETDRILELFANPRIKGSVARGFSNVFAQGELSDLTSQSFTLFSKPLRLSVIKYTFWDTELEYEEDESTLGVK